MFYKGDEVRVCLCNQIWLIVLRRFVLFSSLANYDVMAPIFEICL